MAKLNDSFFTEMYFKSWQVDLLSIMKVNLHTFLHDVVLLWSTFCINDVL